MTAVCVGSGLVLASPVIVSDIVLCSPALLMSYFSDASDLDFAELFFLSAMGTPLIAPFLAYPFGIAHVAKKEKEEKKASLHDRKTIEGAKKFWKDFFRCFAL